MALQDYFTVNNWQAGRTENYYYTPEKLIALRNFKNDKIIYQQQGNADHTYIKIGLDRPFRQVYFDIKTPYPPLPGVGRSAWFYSTGTGYAFEQFTPEFFDDETGLLRNSGFFKIRKVPSDWGTDDRGQYSIFIWCTRLDQTQQIEWEIPIRGINYVFSDDNDLQRIRSDIVESSQGNGWGPKHLAARDFIMQQLRIKFQNKDLTAFDVVNPWELREASAFFALANIYKYELSKMTGDIFDNQAQELYMKAKKSFSTVDLSIDTNRSGDFTAADTDIPATDEVGTMEMKWT